MNCAHSEKFVEIGVELNRIRELKGIRKNIIEKKSIKKTCAISPKIRRINDLDVQRLNSFSHNY